jgi:hypothetical protein
MDDKLHTGTGVFFIGFAAGSQTQFSGENCLACNFGDCCPVFHGT